MASAGIPIVVIMLICLAVLFSYILSQVSGRRSRAGKGLSSYMRIGIYVVVLLFAMGLSLIIPPKVETKEVETNGVYNIPSLHQMAYEGQLDDSVHDYLVYKKEFDFPFEKKQLNIQSIISSFHYFTIFVLIEEKDEEDDVIEARLYQTPSYFNGINITEDIKPYETELHANTLTITAHENSLSYAYFKTEFPMSQFQKNRVPMFEEEIYSGEQLVYLRIPKG